MAGVYKLFNKVNGNFYIGGTVQSFRKRINKHYRSMKDGTHNKLIMQDFYEYGLESFDYEVLEECSKEDCLLREQHYIDELNPYYNIAKKALNNFGFIQSESFKNKMSKSMKKFYDSEKNIKVLLMDINSIFIYKILNINTNQIYFEQSIRNFGSFKNINYKKLRETFTKNGITNKQHKGFKIIDMILIDDFIKEYLESKNI